MPPYLRVAEESTCKKGLNNRPIRSGGMPIPVSVTVHRTVALCAVSFSVETRTTTLPLSVNLIALPVRFMTTCCSLPGSPRSNVGTSE